MPMELVIDNSVAGSMVTNKQCEKKTKTSHVPTRYRQKNFNQVQKQKRQAP